MSHIINVTFNCVLKTVEATFLVDRTTETKDSGRRSLEYSGLPKKETKGLEKDEVKKVRDKTPSSGRESPRQRKQIKYHIRGKALPYDGVPASNKDLKRTRNFKCARH